MIVVTSFLYAKDNHYLILDAVKKLASRKCKGLIIKNIFNLPIRENVIRYADAMNFPIILVEGIDIHYEDLIILINQRVKHYSSVNYRENKVDEILRNGTNNELIEKLAYEIMKEFARKYIKPLEDFDLETDENLLETAVGYVLNDGDLQKTADAMIQHKNTIRYRLKNISNILEMNIFESKNYETLSCAVRIYMCNDKVI